MPKLRDAYYTEQIHISADLSPDLQQMLERVKAYHGFVTNAETLRYLIASRARALEEKELRLHRLEGGIQ